MAQPFTVTSPDTELPVWSVDGQGNVIASGAAQYAGQMLVGAGKTPTPGNAFMPSDHGYLGWNGDPGNVQGGTILVNGTVYVCRIPLRAPLSPANVVFALSAVAVTPTAGQSFAGLYDSSGTLLASAGIDTQILSTGIATASIAPGVVQPGAGWCWAAIVANAATAPTLQRFTTTGSPPNAGLPAQALRWAVAGTSATALPSSFTPSSLTATGAITTWMAIS